MVKVFTDCNVPLIDKLTQAAKDGSKVPTLHPLCRSLTHLDTWTRALSPPPWGSLPHPPTHPPLGPLPHPHTLVEHGNGVLLRIFGHHR